MGRRSNKGPDEFEHYEGIVIDRKLGKSQQSTLRLLPEIDVSSTGFEITLPRGNGSDEMVDLFERTADVYLYFNNGGSRSVIFRIPTSALSLGTVRPYLIGDRWQGLTAEVDGKDLVLRYAIDAYDSEGFNAGEEGTGWLHLIAPVRAELISGKLDVLELGMLLGQLGDRTKGEPDLPAAYGLSKASRILAAYMLIEPEALEKWARNR